MNLSSSEETTTTTNNSKNVTKQNKNKRHQLRKKKYDFALFNARSLTPKIKSVSENFDEREWAFAIATETWFVDGDPFEETKRDLKNGCGIDSICANRNATRGRNSGGGAAILFKRSKVSLKQYPIKRSGCEIVATKVWFSDCRRPTFIIGIYMPPGMIKSMLDKYVATLSDSITKIKLEEKNPISIIGGDFNRYDVTAALADHLDITEASTPLPHVGAKDLTFYIRTLMTQ